jgi:hypothetical protein
MLHMAIGTAIVVMTVIVVACFVGPGFWGYEWIHGGECFTALTALGKVVNMWTVTND